MKLLFDFFPILIFFIIFKFFNIYVATAAFLITSFLQIVIYWIKYRKLEKMYFITFLLGGFLGGATLLMHDELFIKWKPTVIYWLFAIVFLSSQLSKKTIIQRLMENNVNLPENIWSRLNLSWALFFSLLGAVNLYVIYHFDTNAWVNFKLFGVVGLTFLFILIQALYLSRYIKTDEKAKN